LTPLTAQELFRSRTHERFDALMGFDTDAASHH
jgi:hypothetical protein